MILLDTNVLVYATDELSEHHEDSKRLVDAVIGGRVRGGIVPQVLVEYMGVVTGSTVTSPLPVADAIAQIAVFQTQIRTFPPPIEALDELGRIALAKGRAGRRVFDFYLAAQARILGIEVICTYNVSDFEEIDGIRAMFPADVSLLS